MIIVVNAAGVAVMSCVGGEPVVPPGGVSYTLTPEQISTFNGRPPNGGILFDGVMFTFLPVE